MQLGTTHATNKQKSMSQSSNDGLTNMWWLSEWWREFLSGPISSSTFCFSSLYLAFLKTVCTNLSLRDENDQTYLPSQNPNGINYLANILPTRPTLTFGMRRMNRASQHDPNWVHPPQSGFQLQALRCRAGLASPWAGGRSFHTTSKLPPET